jgi:hypothetical protein
MKAKKHWGDGARKKSMKITAVSAKSKIALRKEKNTQK